jgi:hypothetical protein
MEKEFVPYELAVRLKPIGFDEPCFVYYRASNENKLAYPNHGVTQNSLCSNGITAPTFSQAFRWFRENYGFPSYVDMDDYSYYRYTIYKGIAISEAPHETYEEAELACLTKLIEIVETRTK